MVGFQGARLGDLPAFLGRDWLEVDLEMCFHARYVRRPLKNGARGGLGVLRVQTPAGKGELRSPPGRPSLFG